MTRAGTFLPVGLNTGNVLLRQNRPFGQRKPSLPDQYLRTIGKDGFWR